MHYDKWSRFENFLKFAERKELKDRLKELDPPSYSNYIDTGTIDTILNLRSKRPPSGQRQKATKDQKASGTEHAERIAKMKELYGLFVKMEEEVKPPDKSNFAATTYYNNSVNNYL